MSKSEPVSELEAMKADLEAFRDELGSISKSLIDQGRKRARAAAKRVTSTAAEVSDGVEAFAGEKPFMTILLAFGAGLLAVRLLKRS